MIRFLSAFEQNAKIMKTVKTSILLGLSLLMFASIVTAQKKPAPARKPVVSAANVTPLEVKAGADKVSVQIKNVTKFLYTLGGIAIRIEDLDAEAKTKTIAKASLDANAANKQKVMTAIRNLRAGIATLEVEFRTKPALTKYLMQVEGITALSAECEDLATAGRFSEAGRPLLLLVEKLSDALVALP